MDTAGKQANHITVAARSSSIARCLLVPLVFALVCAAGMRLSPVGFRVAVGLKIFSPRMVSGNIQGRVSIGRLTARAAPIPGRFAPCALASMKERRLLNATNVAIKNDTSVNNEKHLALFKQPMCWRFVLRYTGE